MYYLEYACVLECERKRDRLTDRLTERVKETERGMHPIVCLLSCLLQVNYNEQIVTFT